MYIYHGHYMLILVFSIFCSYIAFIFSTLYEDKKGIYNWILGFILMEVSSGIVLYLFANYYHNLTMGTTRYYIVYGV